VLHATSYLKGPYSKPNPILSFTAVIICTDAPQGLAYARDLVADHGTLVIIAGNVENMKFTWLDFLNRDLKIKGTLSGNGSDLKECVELCAKYGVESSLTVYMFEEEEMNRMVQDCKQPGWAGKAVVTIGSH
jgi:D-arabinose 1-dehydrogenase-like Zn-dependent alcohol dehydrogenase